MPTIDEIVKARIQGKPIVSQTSGTLPVSDFTTTEDSSAKPSIDEIVKKRIKGTSSVRNVEQAVSSLTPKATLAATTTAKPPVPVLSGQTQLRQAPEKRWPLGFVGAAAKSAYTTAKDTIEGAADKILEFLGTLDAESQGASGNITDYTGEDYSRSTGETIGMTPEQRKAFYEQRKDDTRPLSRAVKGGQAALGVANIAFLPVTMQLEAAKEIPLLKYPAQGASWVFEKLGEAGGFVMEKAVDVAPLDTKTKDTIRPLAQELGAFLGQLIGVKYGMKAVEKGVKGVEKLPVSEKSKQNINKTIQHTIGISMVPFSHAYGVASGMLAQKIAERQQSGVKITAEEGKKIIEEIKEEIPKEIEKEQAKNPTPTEADLDLLAKSSATEATHSMKEVRMNLEELGYSKEQITKALDAIHEKNPAIKRYTKDIVDSEIGGISPKNKPKAMSTAKIVERDNAITKQKTLLKEREIKAEKPEVVPEVKTPEVNEQGKKVSAVYERLKKEHPDILKDDASREAIKMKEDAERAHDLMEKNRDEAYSIALGHESRSDVTNTAVNIAMSNEALREGNYELFNQLVKSRSFQQSRRGAEINAEKGSVSDNSTSRYFKDLLNMRLENLGDSFLGNLKDTFKRGSKKQRGIDVIDSEIIKVEKKIKAKKLNVKEALILLDKLTCV